MPEDPQLTLVTMQFDAADGAQLQAVLSKYAVLTRGHPGCRNVDFCRSALAPDRFVIIEKWATPADQRAHFDSADMVAMAEACQGLLTRAPQIDLLDAISAHDLH